MNKKFCIYSIVSLLFFAYTQELLTVTPKISIITSIYNGNEFIEGFLADITRQTIFDQCELILINANSPGNEEPIIKKYMEKYPNIVYKRLDKDPGLYGCWNIAISMSRGIYLTNANLDDRLSPECYQVHSKGLDDNPDVLLVYSDRYYTEKPNETFEKHTGEKCKTVPEFSKHSNICLPGPNPMWRKTLHARFGFFNETYKYSGDWEMWLRAVEDDAQFKKIAGRYCLTYINPQGLSTNNVNFTQKEAEDRKILARYSYLWGGETYREFYQLACTLDKKNNKEQQTWTLALSYYLKAFSLNPLRAEPLVRIAQHYYSTQDHALSYLFARRACDLACPKDEDVEKELYEFTRYDLLAIASWYTGHYENGQEAAKKALEARPDDKRLQKNLQFYIDRKNSQKS